MAAPIQNCEPGICSTCALPDNCKYCEFIKAGSVYHNRITYDFVRELFNKEATANHQLCQAQAREAQVHANLEQASLEIQNGRRQVTCLTTQLNNLRKDYGRIQTQHTKRVTEYSELGKKHQLSEETLQLMVHSLTHIAKELFSLSSVVDRTDETQNSICIDNLILQDSSQMPAVDALCHAVRQTILRANADVETVKERMYGELENRESVIRVKDERIGELLESVSVLKPDNRRQKLTKARAHRNVRDLQLSQVTKTHEQPAQCVHGTDQEGMGMIKEEQ